MAGGFTWRVFGAPISKKGTGPHRLLSDGLCAIENFYAMKYRRWQLPILVISSSKCVEIFKEIKLPDFRTDAPGVVSEMLIPLAEVPRDRELHLRGVRVIGVIDDRPRHTAEDSLNDIEKLCGRRKWYQFDDRANR